MKTETSTILNDKKEELPSNKWLWSKCSVDVICYSFDTKINMDLIYVKMCTYNSYMTGL